MVTEANCPERLAGAPEVMEAASAAENLVVIWVEQGFEARNFHRVIQQLCAAKVDVIFRTEPGFHVLPKRWIVERTFGWWNPDCLTHLRRFPLNQVLQVKERMRENQTRS